MSDNSNGDFGQTSSGGGGSLRLDQQGSMPVAGQELRRHLRRAGMVSELSGLSDVDVDTNPPADGQALVYDTTNGVWQPGAAGFVAAPVLTGTNVSTTALSVDLVPGGTVGGVGIPVAASMQATDVAVSWLAAAPSSGWTLTLHKRTGGGTLNEVATFTINTT